MPDIAVCPECGVPEPLVRDNVWLNSGAVVQSNDMTRRVGFIESENLDPLYSGISEIVGVPIDRLITDIARKGTVEYITNITPPGLREAARSGQLDLRALAEALFLNIQILGFGVNKLVDLKESEYMVVRVTESFCIRLSTGIVSGGCEAVTGSLYDVTYKEVSPDVYEVKAYRVEGREEDAEGRLQLVPYRHREGDIELARCASCGGPKALSKFNWNLNKGKIISTLTSRRMALIGPEVQDPLFDELERELGETIPVMVVESQRRFVKTGFYSLEEMTNVNGFRSGLALRGVGNLRDFEMGTKGLRMRVDNAACRLMIVGMVQGLFEMAFDTESSVEWEVSDEGDLEVKVTPHTVREFLPA